MPYADLGDYKFYYREEGEENSDNGTILFLHGFTLDSRMWQNEIDEFSQSYHVIALDFKGHGQSDAPTSGYTRKERVEDLKRYLDCLNLKDIHVVGLSYGGTTGLGLALKYPEYLKSLTLVSSAAAGYKLSPKIGKIDEIAKKVSVETAKARWIKTSLSYYREDQKDIRDFVKMMMDDHSGAIWADPKRGSYPQEDDLSKVSQIKLPVNIIVGEEDKLFVTLGEKLHQKIKGSKYRVLKNTGHLVNLENPTEFQSCLGQFLSSL